MAAEPELIIRFKGDTKDLESQIGKLKSSLGELTPATEKASTSTKKLDNANSSLTSSVGKLAAGYLTFQAALSAGKYILDATLQVQKFETQLKTASGGQEQFGKNMSFLEDLASTYKKNVVDLGASFAQLTIATKGTNLEGAETEKLFKAVTVASAALKMSTDDTNGTFRAFIQMVSKGTVQAEELRGQLGERLFGAFNIAARAMGKTTAELNTMLQKGEVLASDLLPRMSDELLNTFGTDAIEGAHSLGSNIEYANGQLTLFVAELAKGTGLTGFFSQAADDAGALIKQLRILNTEVGAGAALLGLMESTFQTLFNNTGIDTLFSKLGLTGAATNFASQKQADALKNKPVPLGSKYPFPSRDKSGVAGSLLSGASGTIGKLPDIVGDVPTIEAIAEKEKKAMEKAARQKAALQKKLDAEDKKNAAQALEIKISDSEIAINEAYRKYNGTIQDVIGEQSKNGLSTILDKNSFDKIGEEFAKGVTGDGKSTKINRPILPIEQLTQEQKDWNDNWFQLRDSTDAVQKEIETNLISHFGSLQSATEAGFGDFVGASQKGGEDFKKSLKDLQDLQAIQDLSTNINNALRQAASDLAFGFGEMVGSALAGGSGFEDAGKQFGLLLAKMLQDIGKALITFAALMIAAETSIENPFVALAAGIAAVAAGAYLKTKINDADGQGLYTGGLVQGPAGTDKIPARLTAGELVLNKRQQSNMFGLINGTNTGRNFNRNFGNSGRDNGFVGQLTANIRSGDLAVAVNIGEKKNNKFR